MLPDYNKYLKYVAFKRLQLQFKADMKESDAKISSMDKLEGILFDSYSKCLLEKITQIDSNCTIASLLCEHQKSVRIDEYNTYLREAFEKFVYTLKKLAVLDMTRVQNCLDMLLDSVEFELLKVEI